MILQTIDNGLKLRFHWITKFGYGRDQVYAPHVNTSGPASDAAPFDQHTTSACQSWIRHRIIILS